MDPKNYRRFEFNSGTTIFFYPSAKGNPEYGWSVQYENISEDIVHHGMGDTRVLAVKNMRERIAEKVREEILDRHTEWKYEN